MKELDSQESIRNLLETPYDNDNVNIAAQTNICSLVIAVNGFSSIFAKADIKVLKLKQDRCNPSLNHTVKYEWFDDECYKLRRILRLKGRKLKRADIIQDESESFRNRCKNYKKMLEDKNKLYKQRLLKEMSTLESSNPKLYWDILTKIKNCDGIHKGSNSSNISPEEWYRHFKELANDLELQRSKDHIKSVLQKLEENKSTMDLVELDFPFTIKEVKAAIISSKNGKSSSDDLILNEMLKSGLSFILPSVTKLFNLILNSEQFPALWNIAHQIPLFKGGDLYNPNDFRGISLTSCLGKILKK